MQPGSIVRIAGMLRAMTVMFPTKKWVFKGMDGMRHVAVFLTRGEKDVLRANKESAEVIMNNCIQKRV